MNVRKQLGLAAVAAFGAALLLLHAAPAVTAQQVTGVSSLRTVIITLVQPAAPDVLAQIDTPDTSLTQGRSAANRDVARARRDAAIAGRLEDVNRPQADAVSVRVATLGGQVVSRLRAFNILVARVPDEALEALASDPGVAAVRPVRLLRKHLDIAGRTTGVSAFWNAGLTGGSTDVAVIDTGLYAGHPAFQGVSRIDMVVHNVAQSFDPDGNGPNGYCDDPHDPDDFDGHGTAVSGVVTSRGDANHPQHLGIARGINLLINLKAAFISCVNEGLAYDADVMTAADRSLSLADPPEVYNLSYGGETLEDDEFTRFWDVFADTFQKVVTISAGNAGPPGPSVSTPGASYNAITVANADDRNTNSRGDDVISGTSSRGPTPLGRRKPDIAAPGTNTGTGQFPGILLPNNIGDWSKASGTSFSAPAIAGAAALLIQANVSDPRAVKAVLLNAAEDRGPAGWDEAWGWGYYDGAQTYLRRNDWVVSTVTTDNAVRLFERSTSQPTKATIVWHRHGAYAGPAYPTTTTLRNLDLELWSRGSGALRAASLSTVDNVEQVAGGTSEPVVVAVRAVGFAPALTETFALAHSGGFVVRQGPRPGVSLAAPPTVAAGSTFAVSATVANDGDLRGHDFKASLTVPAGYTLVGGSVEQALGALEPGAQGTATWTITAPPQTQATSTFVANVSSTSYNTVRSATGSANVATDTVCAYAIGPTSVTVGSSPTGGNVNVLTSGGCAWTGTSNVPWITVGGAGSGTGSGSISYAVEKNSAATPRTGTLTIAGQTFTVSQTAFAPTFSRYLAEGATGSLWDMRLALLNPTTEDATVTFRFLPRTGAVITENRVVPKGARLTLNPESVPGLESAEFSTVVEGSQPVVVDRTMSWDSTDGYGSHAETAVLEPALEWYFAEGATHSGFSLFYLIQNPNPVDAQVEIEFLLPTGHGPVTYLRTVPANSRDNVLANLIPGLQDTDVSAVVRVTNNQPVIVERAMYLNVPGGRLWEAGHNSAGVTATSTNWFLAEGSTGGGYFKTFVLLANPNPVPAVVTVRFLRQGAPPISWAGGTRSADDPTTVTLEPNSRQTIYLNLLPGLENTGGVSTVVTSSIGILAERAMWWPFDVWTEAHNSFGATSAGLRWALAEGEIGGTRNTETYVLIANTSAAPALVRVTLVPDVETPFTLAPILVLVPANERITIGGAEFRTLPGKRFGAIVESITGSKDGTIVTTPAPIVVERAMYSDANGVKWAAGTNALATKIQ